MTRICSIFLLPTFHKRRANISYNVGYNVSYNVGYNFDYNVGYNIGYNVLLIPFACARLQD